MNNIANGLAVVTSTENYRALTLKKDIFSLEEYPVYAHHKNFITKINVGDLVYIKQTTKGIIVTGLACEKLKMDSLTQI